MGRLIELQPGSMVNEWQIVRKLGEGAFGAVYVCARKGELFALKVEGIHEKVQLLKMEAVVLTELKQVNSMKHFCTVEDKGRHERFIYLVMTLVGKSLQDLRKMSPNKRFSIGTVCSVGIQCVEALEELHAIGYLHRDVKPGNFACGRKELRQCRRIFLLDFGMCRQFCHSNGEIKKPRTAAGFRGTLKYAPLACHILRDQCRKDDLESLLYMLVELIRGKLPWRNLVSKNEVGVCKKRCRVDKGINRLFGECPRRFVDILRICDKTRYFDEPDYTTIKALLQKSIVETRSEDIPYDWERSEFGFKAGPMTLDLDLKACETVNYVCEDLRISKTAGFSKPITKLQEPIVSN
ncbi:hypothetical protein AB6A40_003352 [Gnathostoma spinigerum]|uniref:Protein kinase domain-containing protein n=1 Tax=Gnathostoma spinigerum TaxID=75299 RepID=A0ABD6E9B4_9BILA